MHITLFGSTERIGRALLDEALERGHEVTAVVDTGTPAPRTHPRIMVRRGDVRRPASVTAVARGRDVVVSAVEPGASGHGARSLVDGVRRAKGPRLVVVDDAGEPAHQDALTVYRHADPEVEWTYIVPAAVVEPGERTGRYRVSCNGALVDADGRSRISIEDLAAAIIDEAENPQHSRQRITFAY
jgi:uncharacterized protein